MGFHLTKGHIWVFAGSGGSLSRLFKLDEVTPVNAQLSHVADLAPWEIPKQKDPPLFWDSQVLKKLNIF